jgi:hypothetical protein
MGFPLSGGAVAVSVVLAVCTLAGLIGIRFYVRRHNRTMRPVIISADETAAGSTPPHLGDLPPVPIIHLRKSGSGEEWINDRDCDLTVEVASGSSFHLFATGRQSQVAKGVNVYSWCLNNRVIGTGLDVSVSLSCGQHVLALTVIDNVAVSATVSMNITVVSV